MSLFGHIGPGAYMFIISVLISLKAMGFKWMRRNHHEALLKVWLSLIFAPLAMLYELVNRDESGMFSMTTIHHMTLYVLVLCHGALIHLCELRTLLPLDFLAVYELGMGVSMGLIFSGHAEGNSLYVAMHKFMFPLLALVALSFFVASTVPDHVVNRRSLYLIAGLVLQIAGQWFCHIGIAFQSFSKFSGFAGAKHDVSMPMDHVQGMVTFWLTLHFLAATTSVTGVHIILKNHKFIDESTDEHGGFQSPSPRSQFQMPSPRSQFQIPSPRSQAKAFTDLYPQMSPRQSLTPQRRFFAPPGPVKLQSGYSPVTTLGLEDEIELTDVMREQR